MENSKKNNMSRKYFVKLALAGAGGLGLAGLYGCDSLNVAPPSQLSDSTIETENGIVAVLNSAYSNIQFNEGQTDTQPLYMEEATTDIFKNFRGFLFRQLESVENFTFNPTSLGSWTGDVIWNKPYRAIRDANSVIGNIDNVKGFSGNNGDQLLAEARFIRALAYHYLYGWFGPVPLITETFKSPNDEFNKPRSSEDEMLDFIETELTTVADGVSGNQAQYGRATKGAVLGILSKFYLQTKQWDKAATAAKSVMDLDQYSLWPDYETLFLPESEQNSEMIFVTPCVAKDEGGNRWPPDAMPPKYPKPSNLINTATQVTTPVAFYNTFGADDKRRNLFLTEYETTDGEHIDLLEGVEYKNPRSFKYPIDSEAVEKDTRTDYPIIRYADILLTRAEGLVMSNGSVTQESIDLMNEVRNRAGLSDYTLADVPDQNAFVDLMLKERAWEFYSEKKRREDLIRHDRFISNARDRGKNNAQEFHRKFPIPEEAIDANPNLKQNLGY